MYIKSALRFNKCIVQIVTSAFHNFRKLLVARLNDKVQVAWQIEILSYHDRTGKVKRLSATKFRTNNKNNKFLFFCI